MTKLTHLDERGSARMVDVSGKDVTTRIAIARGFIYMQPTTVELVFDGGLDKGEALGCARIAGVMAAKKTDELIPLCHGLPLDQVTVDFTAGDGVIGIEAMARCSAKTGVEMEALTAVNIAALTLYDMAKGVDKSMHIGDVHLFRKRGGRSGDFEHSSPPGPELDWT